jgi:hypothetical protein
LGYAQANVAAEGFHILQLELLVDDPTFDARPTPPEDEGYPVEKSSA